MKMASQAKKRQHTAHQLSELVNTTLTPAARKRGFASVDLIAAWPELVGPRYSEKVQPGQLIWPRTKNADGEQLAEPATLLVYTDGPTSLFFSHEIPQLRERINRFFGWCAVGRIKVMQRQPMRPQTIKKQPPKQISAAEKAQIQKVVAPVQDDRLRAALEKLGTAIRAKSSN
ncbi:DUF721 domain-containing protein [Polycladidibacter hongkongensis]|uniref:DUF721 domain-containing protein n=1 Tax=Polycladidibacter hongkongensis TaxID=1647556 RepID=UPI0009E7D3FE|nr:DciA family protein [Pseudovibrio hongkongensis]